jgi:hypothetical protein
MLCEERGQKGGPRKESGSPQGQEGQEEVRSWNFSFRTKTLLIFLIFWASAQIVQNNVSAFLPYPAGRLASSCDKAGNRGITGCEQIFLYLEQ